MTTEEYMKYRAEFMDKIQALLSEEEEKLDPKYYRYLLKDINAHLQQHIYIQHIKNRK